MTAIGFAERPALVRRKPRSQSLISLWRRHHGAQTSTLATLPSAKRTPEAARTDDFCRSLIRDSVRSVLISIEKYCHSSLRCNRSSRNSGRKRGDRAGFSVFFKRIVSVDDAKHTVTLPLHHGLAKGETVWYVVTDASNISVARKEGVDYAPDIAKLGDAAIAKARTSAGIVAFPGAPDFSPQRSYVAGATGFSPRSAKPGGVADDAYSSFVEVDGRGGVLNAPIVATGDGPFDVTTHSNTEDRVVAIDTANSTVTLVLACGFVDGKPVFYLSTEASDPVAAFS